MTTEQINKMIDEYFDGNLPRNKEAMLFTSLSSNDESREYFKNLNKIRTVIEETIEEFPDELEERILRSAANSNSRSGNFSFANNLPAFLSYGMAVILLLVTLMFYFKSVSYKDEIDSKIQQVNQQGKLIELLMNNMPSAEVEGNFTNQIIVRPNI